jgi:hypothetical protein
MGQTKTMVWFLSILMGMASAWIAVLQHLQPLKPKDAG